MHRHLVCILLVMAVGCTSGSTTPSQVDRTTDSLPATVSDTSILHPDLDLPLDWVNVEYSRVSFELGRAETILIASCLQSRGFDVSMNGLFQVLPGPYTLDRRYSTYTAETARTRGYQPEVNDPRDLRQLPVPEDTAQRAAFLLALTGAEDGLPRDVVSMVDPVTGAATGSVVIPGGCQKGAVEQIYGSLEQFAAFRQDDYFIQTLTSEAQATAAADPELEKQRQDWASCMSAVGYQYDSPSEPQFAEWPEPRPTTDEIDTAVADMTCRESTKYLTIVAAAERRSQTKLIDSHTELLAEILLTRDAVLARAKGISSAVT